MRRGDLFLAELQPRTGAELRGVRPVLILSHDSFNQAPGWRSVTVVPLITSAAQARRGPTAVYVPDGAGGLKGAGIAACHQITTLDRSKLTRRIGAVPADVLAAVEAGIKAALDLS
jgi:mRNA interferase MazF